MATKPPPKKPVLGPPAPGKKTVPRMVPKKKPKPKGLGWLDTIKAGYEETKQVPGALVEQGKEASSAIARDIKNALPGKDPYPYRYKRDPKTGKMVIERDKNGKPLPSSGHAFEYGLDLAGEVIKGAARTTADAALIVSKPGYLDKGINAAVGKVSPSAGKKLDEITKAHERKAQAAEARVTRAPVSTILTGAWGAGQASKLITVPALARDLRALNPGLTKKAATTLAEKESRRPGSVRAAGYKGGITRTVTDKQGRSAPARSISRSPIGRAAQGAFDASGRGIDAISPNIPGSASRRVSSLNRRAAAQEVKRAQAARLRLEQDLADALHGPSTIGKVKRASGAKTAPLRENAEALIAALEGPSTATIREAVQLRLASLESILSESEFLRPMGDEIKALRTEIKRADVEGNDAVRAEAATRLREVTAKVDLALGKRVAPVRNSAHRTAALDVFRERFGEEKAAALIQVSDALARSSNPDAPQDWYATRLSEVTSEEGAAAVARIEGIADGMFQREPGWRRGLLELPDTRQVNGPEGIRTEMVRAIENPADEQAIFFRTTEGQEGVVTHNTFSDDWDVYDYETRSGETMTDAEVEAFLNEGMEGVWSGNQGAASAFETPVYYSQLQRTVQEMNIPPKGLPKGDMMGRIKNEVSPTEYEMMGLKDFFDRYGSKERISEADIQEFMSSPLNAYNLDEVVREAARNVPNDMRAKFGWLSARPVDVYEEPTGGGRYFELTMTLGNQLPRQADTGPYTKTGWDHWNQDNVVVHVRFHSIIDSEGKKAILIDEIQSDWANDYNRAGRPVWDAPEDPARVAERQRLWIERTQVQEELRPHTEWQNEVNRAYEEHRIHQRRFFEWPGGDPAEQDALRAAFQLSEARIAVLENNKPMPIDVVGDLRDRLHTINSALRTVEKPDKFVPPPLGTKQFDAAVKRMMRWAYEEDADRIIIVPGELQALRNDAFGITPSDMEIDLMRWHPGHNDDAGNMRMDMAGLTPEQFRRWAQSPEARQSGKANTYFSIYDQQLPKLFEKYMKTKGGLQEGAFEGVYTSQANVAPSWGPHAMPGYVIDMSSQAREAASVPMRLMQRQPDWDGLPRGATDFLADGKTALRLFEGADVDTVIHELAHIALPDIDPEFQSVITAHFGGSFDGKKWNTSEQSHEAFARAFEIYFRDGRAANVQLASAFQQIANWMRGIWQAMRNEQRLDPEVAMVFDRMLGRRGTDYMISNKQINQLKDQTSTLRDILEGSAIDSQEMQEAFQAVTYLSDQIDALGQQILTRGVSDPDLRTAILEGLDRRKNIVVNRMIQQGLIKEGETARGYFPQSSIWEIPSMPNVAPSRMPAVGATIGTPRLTQKALNRKVNKLYRYSTGEVFNDPTILASVLNQRLRYMETLRAREELWQSGRPVKAGEDLPKGQWALVRNPNELPEKLALEIRAAQELSPERYAELENRGALTEIDEMADTYETLQDVLWFPGSGPKPRWAAGSETVRIVPLQVAKSRVGDVFQSPSAGVVGALSAAGGIANSMARLSSIYLPYGGTRYMVRNAMQNWIMLAATNPSALLNLFWSDARRMQKTPEGKDLYNRIAAETGTIQATALPEFNVRAQGRVQKGERWLVDTTGKIGNQLGRVADNPYRFAAYMANAKKLGLDTDAKISRMLDDPEMADVRQQLLQQTRDDMIDFDALTPFEKEVLSRYLFIWPFIRGITKWPFMYAREYPGRTAVAFQAAAISANEGESPIPQSVREAGVINIGGRPVNIGWLDPTSPLLQNAEIAQALWNGKASANASALAGLLAPHWKEVIQSLAGMQGKDPWTGLENTYVPGASTKTKIEKGGSLLDQVMRYLGADTDLSVKKTQEKVARDNEINNLIQGLEAQGVVMSQENFDKLNRAHSIYQEWKAMEAKAKSALQAQGNSDAISKGPGAIHKYKILAAITEDYYPGASLPDEGTFKGWTEKEQTQYFNQLEKALWGTRDQFIKAAEEALGGEAK